VPHWVDRRSSIPVGTPQRMMMLLYSIACWFRPCPCFWISYWCTLACIVAPILNSALLTLPTPSTRLHTYTPFRHSSTCMGAPQSSLVLFSLDLVLLTPHWHSSTSIWCSFSFCIPSTPSVYFSCPHSTPHLACLVSWWLLPLFIRIIVVFQIPTQIYS